MDQSVSLNANEGGTRPSSTLLALAAVASRLGVDTDVPQLRRRFSLDTGDPDTGALISLARELGLEAQALSIGFSELPRLSKSLPAILRATDGSALLLEDARRLEMAERARSLAKPGALERIVGMVVRLASGSVED